MRTIRIYRDGYRYGILAKEGNKWDTIIVMGCPIDTVRVPADDDTQFTYLDYPVAEAIKRFQKAAKTLGITARARDLLKAP